MNTRIIAGMLGLLVGLSHIASATEYNLDLLRATTGSSNGASDAVTVNTLGTWVYDDATNVVTLDGTFQADFDLSPAPGNELFSHAMTDVVIDLDAVSINGSAYECIEGAFGGLVGANLCANVSWGDNFLNETTWDYSTIPGTRIVGGDDVAAGPQQQLGDYASELNFFDGSMLVIQSPAWSGDPGVAGVQLEFLVIDAPPLRDIPDVVGLEQTVAETTLVSQGLTVGQVLATNDPDVPAGLVISQDPFACIECAMLNDPVNLTVSLGPLPVLTIPERIDALIDAVLALNLKKGLENSLIAKLDAALAQTTDGNPNNDVAAANMLDAFINTVEAKSGKGIAPEDAEALIGLAQEAIDDILFEPPESGLHTVMSGGVERVYYLRMPENYSRFGDPQPIIFGLHGATGTYMDWFEGGFHGDGLQELVGDQAIMVFPQALESTGGITLWNAEHDFAYFEDMLAKLKGQLQIDPNRIFVTGHSAGGGFTHQLGCEFGDVIRAIAPSSGALTARECIGSVAVMQMQSNQDMVTPIGIVVPSRNFWVAYNGFDRDTFSDGIVEPCIDYSLGASLYPVQWCEHSSTGFNGHQWWDGADEAIWAFFSSLPTAAPSPEPPPGGGNDAVLEEFPALLTFTVHYPEDILEVIIFGAVLYPAGTMQPIFNAPLWFLNTEIPFAPAIPGSVQTYTDVPIAIFESSPGTPLPGTYTLSISAFVLGGSFPIPATGIDHIALHQIEIQDQLSPIVVEEVLELVPVESF